MFFFRGKKKKNKVKMWGNLQGTEKDMTDMESELWFSSSALWKVGAVVCNSGLCL